MSVSNATLKKVAVLGGIVAISGASFFNWRIQDNFRNQPYYQRSVELLNGYPPAVALLGPPIRTRRLNLGDTDTTFSTGLIARLAIPISGKKQRGTLHCWASRISANDRWNVDKLDLEINNMTWTFYIDPHSTESTTNGDILQSENTEIETKKFKNQLTYI